jgi:hypothetical protein
LILLIIALAGTPNSPTSEPPFLEKDAYRAIWADLALNAMIGNGNEVAGWDWYYGADRQNGPTIRIKDMVCDTTGQGRRCHFLLARNPNPNANGASESQQPRLLKCSAELEFARDHGWAVTHFPPHDGYGHTRTSMVCRRG